MFTLRKVDQFKFYDNERIIFGDEANVDMLIGKFSLYYC